jgi:hypothetical protein
LDADLARQAAWENTAAYATDPANDIFSRVKRLDTYAENHEQALTPPSPETSGRNSILNFRIRIRAQREEAARRQALARQQAEQANRAKEARRIQKLEAQVAQQLEPCGKPVHRPPGRYVHRSGHRAHLVPAGFPSGSRKCIDL